MCTWFITRDGCGLDMEVTYTNLSIQCYNSGKRMQRGIISQNLKGNVIMCNVQTHHISIANCTDISTVEKGHLLRKLIYCNFNY